MDENRQFEVIEHFLRDARIARHQIESFNHFIDEDLQKVVNEENSIAIRTDGNTVYKYTFGEVCVTKPCIVDEHRVYRKTTPLEARFKDFTYEGNVLIDIHVDVLTDDGLIVDSEVIRKFHLTKIPIMLGSNRCILRERDLTFGAASGYRRRSPSAYVDSYGECMFEPGGYFIVKGKERVLISQERAAYNTVISTFSGSGSGDVDSNVPSQVHTEIRSISYETGHSTLTECILTPPASFVFIIPYISQKIPIGIVFQAMGIADDTRLTQILSPPHIIDALDVLIRSKWSRLVRTVVRETKILPDTSADAAIAYIASFIAHTTDSPEAYVAQVLTTEIFPHYGCSPGEHDYVWMLSSMCVHTMMVHFRLIEPDSKDHLMHKRVECAGTLMHDLFRTSFKRFVRGLVPYLQKCQNIQNVMQRANNIHKDIRHCFMTGNWGLQKNSYVKTGVSQVLSRLSYVATLSHLSRINMHVGKEVKSSELRQIHQSSAFFLDPAETPEGVCVGIVKNLALTSSITTHVNTVSVRRIVLGAVSDCDAIAGGMNVPVLLNNVRVGCTSDPHATVNMLRDLRRTKVLNHQVSISYSPTHRVVRVWSDRGRYIRPLLVLPAALDTSLLAKCKCWSDYMDLGIVQMLDPYELETSVVAMTLADAISSPGKEYLELHPACMMGAVGSTIPFPDHNQAPRVCYYSSMAKQTSGVFATNMAIRTDTAAYTLDYTQAPIVSTRIARMLGNSVMASGINCIMAIANYTGLNQEDCVIVNKAAVDRGLFVSHVYRTITIDEKRPDSYASFMTCIPPSEYMDAKYNYHKLDSNGIVRRGVYVEANDVLVGRVVKKSVRNREIVSDASVAVNVKEEGFVDDIFIVGSPDGHRIIKIRIRSLRIPELGDKVAQVSGQKGTIGLVCPQEDMPFTAEGLIPDIIVNSHAIPSRMTISMLLEVVLGKACLMEGVEGDATPFSSSSTNIADSLCDRLEAVGFERSGYEIMYNGTTGEQFQSQIFIGPTFYHKLKHMVSDKIYARGFGQVQMLTCQPTVGRSKQGALRVGEMERDCIIAQGCSSLLVDRLYMASDPYSVHVCTRCGQLANRPDYCDPCGNADVVRVRTPYAFKLLQKMLLALNIKMNIAPEES